jgi:hypothetical protein
MIDLKFDSDAGIAVVTPSAPLAKQDFMSLAEKVDPYIEKEGQLNGLIIHVESFPGWEDFGGLISHLKFVREHHKKILKVAVVSESSFLSIMPMIADHFVSAEIQHFPFADLQKAISWIKS